MAVPLPVVQRRDRCACTDLPSAARALTSYRSPPLKERRIHAGASAMSRDWTLYATMMRFSTATLMAVRLVPSKRVAKDRSPDQCPSASVNRKFHRVVDSDDIFSAGV